MGVASLAISAHVIVLVAAFPFSVGISEAAVREAPLDTSDLSTFLGSLLPTSLLFR